MSCLDVKSNENKTKTQVAAELRDKLGATARNWSGIYQRPGQSVISSASTDMLRGEEEEKGKEEDRRRIGG